MKRLFKRSGEDLTGRVKRLEEELKMLRRETKLHKEIETYYVGLICDAVEKEVAKAVETAFQHPIEMTHEEIEKAFSHKIKIVASK